MASQDENGMEGSVKLWGCPNIVLRAYNGRACVSFRKEELCKTYTWLAWPGLASYRKSDCEGAAYLQFVVAAAAVEQESNTVDAQQQCCISIDVSNCSEVTKSGEI